jgi:hypothetical protein
MPRLRSLTIAVAFTAACAGHAPQPAPQVPESALSGLAAQRIAVLPTYIATVAADLHWTNIGRPLEIQRNLDADILSALDDRGLRKTWVFPEELAAAYRKNPTYATDPFQLAEEPLRARSLTVDTRLPEPLASQVRTLVALQTDVRYVLAPVEIRLEPVPGARSGTGRGVLRLVLLDARGSNVRWFGEISSDDVTSFGPAISATIAQRLANVISPR